MNGWNRTWKMWISGYGVRRRDTVGGTFRKRLHTMRAAPLWGPGTRARCGKSREIISECLDSCLRLSGVRVVVVDNDSQDATLDIVRRRTGIRLIANPTNRGFAAACNQGIAVLDTTFVLLLNPDAVLVSGLQD